MLKGSLSIFAVLVVALCQTAPTRAQTVDQGQPITAAELSATGYAYPTDVVKNANHTQLANYAWRLFIASNQLTTATTTDGSQREVPSQSFLDSGKQPLWPNPVIFEGLYHRAEAYPAYSGSMRASPIGQAPTYWFNNGASTPTPLPNSFQGQYVTLDEDNQIGENKIYYEHSTDPDFPLLFMAKVNATEVDYARKKASARQAPSASSTWVFPTPIIEIKAAWRPVNDIPSKDQGKYHQATANYYTGSPDNPTQMTDTFALVGLHIIQKTPNYPTFIFTTFEHVDAVTRDGNNNITDPVYKPTYLNLSYGSSKVADKSSATVLGAYDVNASGQPPGNQNGIQAYKLPAAGPVPKQTVIVQPKTITKEVNDVNTKVQQLIPSDNIWANYRLKGVQAVPTSDEGTRDFFLANIVIESSQPGIQLFKGSISLPYSGHPTFTNERSILNITTTPLVEGKAVPAGNYTMGGCMGCHGVAQVFKGQDFSFVANGNLGTGFPVDTVERPGDHPLQAIYNFNNMLESRAKQVAY